MSGGGIIINRHAMLMPAAMDSSIYSYMTDEQKDAVEAVAAKAPGDLTEQDIHTLAQAIAAVCTPC